MQQQLLSQNLRIANNTLFLFSFAYDSCGKMGSRLAVPQSALANAPNSRRTSDRREGAMSYNVKLRIAECHRRAEEYKRLYHRASSFDERDAYLSTRREFLRLAEDLEKTHAYRKAKRSA